MSAPYYQDEQVTVLAGDCLDVMAGMPAESVHAIVTDPPYGLGFMGREWDGLPPGEPWARECLRVLKPGGHLLAFGGSRTWHRLAVAVEDAGFEIRDSIAWLYGSGFPKSLDVSKAIDKMHGAERAVVGFRRPEGSGVAGAAVPDSTGSHIWSGALRSPDGVTPEAQAWQGWGTALKPAFEPIVVARKPLAGTVAGNVLAHGTGALNIDGCRIGIDDEERAVIDARSGASAKHEGHYTVGGHLDRAEGERFTSHAAGRWPTNVLLDEAVAAELDKQSGITRDGTAVNRNRTGMRPHTVYGEARVPTEDHGYGGEGGASRFFKVFSQTPSDLVFLPVECETWQPPGDASTRAESTSAGRSTESRSASSPIGGYGSKQTDPSPTATRSTTGTTIPSTTTSTTSCASPPSGTTTTTSDSASSTDGSPELRSAAASGATPTSRSTPSPSDGLAPSTATAGSAPRHTAESGSPETATSSTHDDARSEHAASTPDFPTFRYQAKAPTRERPFYTAEDGSRVAHPTTKPLDLMRWLVRLVTPPGGTVLDPFAGSGTTAEACVIEGFQCIAIEREADYLPLIKARLTKPLETVLDLGGIA